MGPFSNYEIKAAVGLHSMQPAGLASCSATRHHFHGEGVRDKKLNAQRGLCTPAPRLHMAPTCTSCAAAGRRAERQVQIATRDLHLYLHQLAGGMYEFLFKGCLKKLEGFQPVVLTPTACQWTAIRKHHHMSSTVSSKCTYTSQHETE